MIKFYYDEAGRKGLKAFLSNTSDIQVSRLDNGSIIITGDYNKQCEISQIVYDSLVNHNVISRI